MQIKNHLIKFEDVNFSYDGSPVLENVSFTIDHGDYMGIVGPNGGGKTTLLKILVGLLRPQSGKVEIEGQPVDSFHDKSKIGYVPQRVSQDNVNFPATVYEIVESGRTAGSHFFGRSKKKDREAIEKAMAAADIDELKDRLIGDLSGGQRQRVYVARALASEPKLLILDEPFVGIDIAAQKDFYALLKELNNSHGLTIIFVSHDIDVIGEEVKSILCLNHGLLCFGSPDILHKAEIVNKLYDKKVKHLHHLHNHRH